MQNKKLMRSMSLPLALLLLALCMFLLPRLLTTNPGKAVAPSPEIAGPCPSQLVTVPCATLLSHSPEPPDKCCLLQRAMMDDRPFTHACPALTASPNSFPWLLWVRHYMPSGSNASAPTAY